MYSFLVLLAGLLLVLYILLFVREKVTVSSKDS